MKHLVTTLLLALFSITAFAAENDSISISGNVLDAFTREYLDSVSVEMYELPSMRLVTKTVIDDWTKRISDPDERRQMEHWNPLVNRRIYSMKGVPGTFLFRFTCKGYQEKEQEITIPPKRYGRRTETWEVKDVLLDKDHTHHIGEAVVTATKIKMMTKGDTLIYNADAFQVADGSMLDGLIAMMPGLEIRDGGRIYHNGEYVPELLLNGKDFFSGDPAIALKNLPAYTVKDLRIYHRAPDGAYLRKDWTQADTLKWNKVLDVRLKKQFSHGWITNAEVAAGYGPTPNPSPKGKGEVTTPIYGYSEGTASTPFPRRFLPLDNEGSTRGVESGMGPQGVVLCRLFGLHFSDHTRLGVFANINNINDTGLANNQGDWYSRWTPEPGVTTMHLGALDFTVDGKKTKINYNTNVQAVREVSDTQSETSATTFLPSGDVYNRSRYSTDYARFHFVWANDIKWNGKKAYFNFRPGLDFFRKTYDTESFSAQYGRPTPNPSPKGRGEVTTPIDGSSENGVTTPFDSLYVPLYLVSTPFPRRFLPLDNEGSTRGVGSGMGPAGPMGPVGLLVNSVNSTLHRTTDTWTQIANLSTHFVSPKFGRPVWINARQSYTYEAPHETQRYALTQLTGNTLENRSTLSSTSSLDIWGNVQYEFHKWGILASSLTYSYSKHYSKNSRERYVQDLSDDALPSTLQTFDLDVANSYHATNNTDRHSLNLPLTLMFSKDFQLAFTPRMTQSRQNYADTRGELGEVTRHNTLFNPSANIFFRWRTLGTDSLANKRSYLTLKYEFDQSAPNISYFLGIRDTSNPLRISLGNPNLANSYTHSLNFNHSAPRPHSQLSTSLSYSRTQHQVAQAMTYNPETGVYTFRPENVDGNWKATGLLSLTLMPKDSPFTFSTRTMAGYQNSVDLISPDGHSDAVRSEVHNTSGNEQLRVYYSHKGLSVRLYGDISWNYATSERLNFTTRSTFDYVYGVTFTANNFLWGLNFSTDLGLRQRRGYDDPSMNDNSLIWDAQLSRSFGKSKAWNVHLAGHDLLRQLSNVTRTINAQGLSETWTNSLPSYLMLHISYRWNKQPNKK